MKRWFSNLFLMLNPIWKYGKLYCICYTVWACITSPISTMIEVYLIQISLDQLSRGTKFYTVALTILEFLAVDIVIYILGELLQNFYFTLKEEEITAKINFDVCQHIKYTDYKYFDNPKYYDTYTVSYAQYSTKSFEAFRNVALCLAQIFTVGTLTGYIVTSTYYVLIITIVSVLIKVYVGKKKNQINIRFEEETAPINRKRSYYHNTLCSKEFAMDIKSTNIYNIIAGHYAKSFDNNIETIKKFNTKKLIWSFWEVLSVDGFTALIRIIICAQILIGKVGVGGYVSLLSAANSLAWKVQGITRYYTSLDKSSLYGEKIRSFINMPSIIETSNKSYINCLNDSSPVGIQIKNLNFKYENSPFSLKNINLYIPAGRKIAFVGENGSGKTTLTKLLLRLYDPNSGEIIVNGVSLTQYNVEQYRNRIGVAFQDTVVYSMSLRDNLSIYSSMNDLELQRLFSHLSFNKVIEKNHASLDTDLTKIFDKDGIVLSGGEKQKLAVTRLFTKEFGLLILDEPTAALDPIAENELNKMIFDKANKSTTIFISHRLSNVVNADYIYVFRDGEIAEAGTHTELMANKGFYHSMFLLQSKNYNVS